MKLSQFKDIVIEAKEEAIVGTNCSNCRFVDLEAKKIATSALNEQGGYDPQGSEEMARAKENDLITLPGKIKVTETHRCLHKDIDMDVTAHMCCALWDANGVYRPWMKSKS